MTERPNLIDCDWTAPLHNPPAPTVRDKADRGASIVNSVVAFPRPATLTDAQATAEVNFSADFQRPCATWVGRRQLTLSAA